MKTLKTENGKKTVLKSFETNKEYFDERWLIIFRGEHKILFSGTKTELKEKPEKFWKSLIDSHFIEDEMIDKMYKNYTTGHYLFFSAKESGISSLEGEHEFILIVEETT